MFSTGRKFDCSSIEVGGYGGNVDITCTNSGGKVLINGVEPTGGGGGGSGFDDPPPPPHPATHNVRPMSTQLIFIKFS